MTALESPTRDNMEIDNERVSPIRTHTRFSDRYKTLFQESPPRDLACSDSSNKSPLLTPSPRKIKAQDTRRTPITIKNEDRGQWREKSAPKVEEKEQEEADNKKKSLKLEQTPMENKKKTTAIEALKPSKIPSPRSSTPAKKPLPHYMLATTSFKSKFDSKKSREALGVRSVGKISKRPATSKIPRYKQQDNDGELKRLSFKGNYITMASRIKSFEKGLRTFKNENSESSNDSSSRSSTPTQSARANTPKFKPFKFATSERAKRHQR